MSEVEVEVEVDMYKIFLILSVVFIGLNSMKDKIQSGYDHLIHERNQAHQLDQPKKRFVRKVIKKKTIKTAKTSTKEKESKFSKFVNSQVQAVNPREIAKTIKKHDMNSFYKATPEDHDRTLQTSLLRTYYLHAVVDVNEQKFSELKALYAEKGLDLIYHK